MASNESSPFSKNEIGSAATQKFFHLTDLILRNPILNFTLCVTFNIYDFKKIMVDVFLHQNGLM